MSMAQPFQPNIRPDEGIPAADAGAGAPEPSPGFGMGGEDPDTVADAREADGSDEPDDLRAKP
ncbi:hypothetical protein [Georgenia faecalis]|uniref:Uncharacterized protein n=1 Tax=Georgenia faecalis TaxID=2483799 RepID=A0ABV9D9G3_9MICO|nr:hypothetical protein [Georgenia faecalis]